jgi:hypothetical protein
MGKRIPVRLVRVTREYTITADASVRDGDVDVESWVVRRRMASPSALSLFSLVRALEEEERKEPAEPLGENWYQKRAIRGQISGHDAARVLQGYLETGQPTLRGHGHANGEIKSSAAELLTLVHLQPLATYLIFAGETPLVYAVSP